MRRLFAIISIAVMAVLASSCYDDSKIFGELSNLGDQLVSMNDRLTKVENDLAALQGDINALAELSQALKSGIYIKSVTALADGTGYTITFSDDRNIVVKNAESDTAPDFAVGVMTVDGKLVWAVNGEPLKNGDKYVEVYAATPIFQVNDKTRKLEVSYDNGNTWVEVGDVYIKVEGSDNAVVASCIFSDVKVDENAGTVTFTLTEDGSKIVLPLSGVFELVIEAEKVVKIGENSAAIPYMVKGADENTVVRVFTAGRCNAEVRKDTILVTNVTGDREILVYADNCKGKTSIKQVKLTRERFSIYGGDSWISYEGGRVNINGISNIDFEVRIPEKVDWITQVETKAEEFFLTFDVAKNETCIFREGTIDLVRKGTDEVLMSWVIYQDANPNVSTTISNAEEFIAFLNTIPTGSYSLNEYTLTADIDLSGVNYDWYQNITAASNGNNSCEMVGASTFKGVLNGCGHKITGFNPTVELPDGTTFGLIPILCHGTIKNLEISGKLNISATGQADAGMLVGTAYNSTIENVTVNGKIVSTGTTVIKRYALGGAVGYAFACEGVNTIIDNVVVNVDTEATGGNNMGNGATGAMYGGVVGFSTAINAADQAIVIIKDCVNNGNMNVTLGRCSGIVATANTGTTIQSCTNNGDQVNKVQNGRLGNIVCNMSHYCNVIDCVNNGDMDATVEGYNGTLGGLIALAGSANGCTISGGGNYGTIRTVGTAGTSLKYVGLLWANHNNRIPTSGVVAGGKIIVDGVEREINESNYMEHIGYIRYPEDVTDIRWGGSDNPSESDMPTIREFAQEYVKIIDVWNANKGTVNYVSPIGVIEEGVNYGVPNIENVNYLPADTKIIVAGVEHTLPQAFDIAVRSYLLLRGYDATDETRVGAGMFAKLDKPYDMDAKILAARPYVYGSAPYNESGKTYADGSISGNGGELKMGTYPDGINKVKVDLLDNFAERNCNWATQKTNGVISNFTSYTGNRIVGYYGCASTMRMILTYAYFFKYMLDNNVSDATQIPADQTFESYLFKPSSEQPTTESTIKEFMTEYVKLIDVWQANVGTVNTISGIGAVGDANDVENAHFIPDDTKLKVGEVEYNLADALELASRSYLLLRGYDGNDTKTYGRNLPIAKLDAAYTVDNTLPETHAYTWGWYPYAERTNGGAFKMVTSEGEFERCKVDLLDDFSHRHTNYPLVTGGAISNFCSYTGGYLAGYDGCCCAKRITLAYAYFFKYMLDNNLQDATSVSADQVFEAPLFGEAPAEPEQPEQPQEPVVLAEWLFTKANLNTYADSFGGTDGVKDNTAGDGGMKIAANVSGTGYISYVQIDKTALDPDKKVQRTVGGTGHPFATGGWVGDYWLFTFGDKAIAKSSKVSINYITRTSKTGMKYWRLEYLDGTEWKPAMATKTVKLTDGTEVDCNIEMNADGSTNVEVDVVVEYANDTAEPCFRMLCLANEQASGNGPLEAINGGTSRIAGAEGTSPVIKLVSAPAL